MRNRINAHSQGAIKILVVMTIWGSIYASIKVTCPSRPTFRVRLKRCGKCGTVWRRSGRAQVYFFLWLCFGSISYDFANHVIVYNPFLCYPRSWFLVRGSGCCRTDYCVVFHCSTFMPVILFFGPCSSCPCPSQLRAAAASSLSINISLRYSDSSLFASAAITTAEISVFHYTIGPHLTILY